MCNNTGEIVLYQAEDGSTSLEVQLQDDTVWLTQAQMVELFGKTKQNISLHTRNIFKEGELVFITAFPADKQYLTKIRRESAYMETKKAPVLTATEAMPRSKALGKGSTDPKISLKNM